MEAFQREWEPLHGALVPLEYLGEGLFACEHRTSHDGRQPVVLWDVAAALSEQTMFELAENAQDYLQNRHPNENPALDAIFERRERKRNAEAELREALECFEDFADFFHSQYRDGATEGSEAKGGFEHDVLNRTPRYDEWKPERFCVHDNLMGVTGYRFNRAAARVEATGFATMDHTNYARASATRALLVCMLSEWAEQSAPKGIVFVKDWRGQTPDPAQIPYELALYGRVLGADLKTDALEISHSACKDLILKLTPFSDSTRTALAKSELSVKACLMALKGIWSVGQIEDLVRYCPYAEAVFDGNAYPEEQVRSGALAQHAKMAAMAGVAERMVRVLAEENEGGVLVRNTGAGGLEAPYARSFVCDRDIRLTCLENGRGEEKLVPAETPFTVLGWPTTRDVFIRDGQTVSNPSGMRGGWKRRYFPWSRTRPFKASRDFPPNPPGFVSP